MRKLLVLFLFGAVVLSGCKETEDCAACTAILNVDGETFVGTGAMMDGKYSPDVLVGKVKKKVAPDVDVIGNWVSNTLKVGTEVYSTHVDNKVLLARVGHDEYEVFILE